MFYEGFKDLNTRTFPDKVLGDKVFNIAKDSNNDGYQRGRGYCFILFLKKKLLLACIKNENISNEDLANDLNKPIIKKSNERKVHSCFIDNIWVRI